MPYVPISRASDYLALPPEHKSLRPCMPSRSYICIPGGGWGMISVKEGRQECFAGEAVGMLGTRAVRAFTFWLEQLRDKML